MRMEAKSTAILLATLAIGVVLGMVGQGMLMRERTAQVGELRRPPGFVAHMDEVIQPRTEQRESIRSVLEMTARRNQQIMGLAREELRAVLDSMRQQLAPLLDPDQRERLARMSRLPDPFRPPPDRPPGGRFPPEGPPGDRPPPDRPPEPPN